jgi:putative transposase
MLASEAQMRGIEPHSPLSLVPRVDDRWIVSSIIFVIRNGLRWRDARAEYGATQDDLQPLHPMEPDLRCGGRRAREARSADDRCNHLKAHRTAASRLKKGMYPDVSDAPKAN